jgi:hypothetical protein
MGYIEKVIHLAKYVSLFLTDINISSKNRFFRPFKNAHNNEIFIIERGPLLEVLL